MTIVVAGVNQHNKNKHLDVENGEGLGVDGNVLSLGSGSLLGLALALEAKLLLVFSF